MVDVELVVLLEPAVAEQIRQGEVDAGPAGAVIDTIQAAGATIAPLHPQTANVALSQDMLSSFVVTAPPGSEVDTLAVRIRPLPGVEAAYVKPRGEAP
jgi:hypothetical protein